MYYTRFIDIFKTLKTSTYYYIYNKINGFFIKRFYSGNKYSSYLISNSFADKSI